MGGLTGGLSLCLQINPTRFCYGRGCLFLHPEAYDAQFKRGQDEDRTSRLNEMSTLDTMKTSDNKAFDECHSDKLFGRHRPIVVCVVDAHDDVDDDDDDDVDNSIKQRDIYKSVHQIKQ
uniref:Uncharacterized protein n=1 Tax=Glossina pallidipes TaxID=7398 RepID=A0A1A9ZFQ0_GLOPL